jgi:hypothetical protein
MRDWSRPDWLATATLLADAIVEAAAEDWVQ